MAGSVLPIAVAHGEGRAEFVETGGLAALTRQNAIALQFVDNRHAVANSYPANPNGAVNGIAGIVNVGGRVLAVDAASGAGIPQRQQLLASGRMGRGRAVGQAVPQRASGARLTNTARTSCDRTGCRRPAPGRCRWSGR